MAQLGDMILPMLHEMRAENLREHGLTRLNISRLEKRLAKMEDAQVSFRQALGARTVAGLVTHK